jgi:hypothetical protein
MKGSRPRQIAVLKLLVAGALLVAAAVNFARNGWATTQVRPYHGQSRSGGITLARMGPPEPPPPAPIHRMPANQPVPMSPALQTELGRIRRALAESLDGSAPLPERHARTFASWVSNLMLDVAYQDALLQGNLQDPVLAEAQVRQAVSSTKP